MDIYLDNAATTRVCPEAADIAYKVMTEQYGNPSSTHARGREAKKLLDSARREVSLCLGCQPKELVFTSCGSEADNWALLSGAYAASAKGGHVISSMAEHDAVRKALDELERRGYEVTRLAPDESGAIPVQAVVDALRPDTVLVSLMLVNNETGAVTDIAGVARALKKVGSKALLHCDAVQGFLKVPFTVKSLGADMVAISGHKIHAPKGIGALYVRSGLHLRPLIVGGSQEDGRRAGTEAMPNICAFGEAARVGRALMAESTQRMAALREGAIERLRAENPGLVVIGGGAPHILCVSLPGYRSEVLMNFLEARGISVSKSSACKKGGRSHVLEAMGLPAPVIDGALRLGLSRFTTQDELDEFCLCLREARESLAHA
ncbi:MAG TPA: cysteine desulfurase [Candidatus Scatomorpha pullistercoris]|uniref:Cysteine desulfurase n=1 Tax=Candidatus Scatomorpha pullistercoris TaxID=2840929 RepID=A0A9D1K9D6_9FIRM|nr:cysteine desulfurase [Candidatus Scatomorpha pullistercoris]